MSLRVSRNWTPPVIEIHGRRRLRFMLGHSNPQHRITTDAHTKWVAFSPANYG